MLHYFGGDYLVLLTLFSGFPLSIKFEVIKKIEAREIGLGRELYPPIRYYGNGDTQEAIVS